MKPRIVKTRTKIINARKKAPGLTDFGIGLPYGTPPKKRARLMKAETSRLFKSEKRFEAACEWLQGLDKTMKINTRHSSYFMKHIAERRIGGHLSNGVFIAAAIHCGFDFQPSHQYPNLFFNIDEDSLQEKYEESLLYEKYPNETRALVQ